MGPRLPGSKAKQIPNVLRRTWTDAKGQEHVAFRWRVWVDAPAADGTIARKRITGTAHTLEAAQREMVRQAGEHETGRASARVELEKSRADRKQLEATTLATLWKEYEKEELPKLDSADTCRGRWKQIDRLLGGNAALSITPATVWEYREKRRQESAYGHDPRPGRNKKRPVSVATRNREVALLRRILSWAASRKPALIPIHPLAAGVEMEDEKPFIRQTVVEGAAFERILAKVETAQLSAMLTVLVDTGMRESEVLGLRRDQLDVKTGRISLAASDTKTNEPRNVYLTERAVGLVRKVVPKDGEWVFPNPQTERPWFPATILRKFQEAAAAAGVQGARKERIRVHDLRRSFVTISRRRGVPESVVQRMSGHRTAAVFKRYNITDDRDVLDAVGVLNSAILRERRTAGPRWS